MKYELLFLDDDFNRRTSKVDMCNLPDRCCAHCDHCVDLGKEYVLCCEHSTQDWDAFAWADDVCEQFRQEGASV